MSDNFSYLREKYGELWKSYVQHEFVLRMKEASLPREAFRYYLIQDSKYVAEMLRALTAAAANAMDDKVSSFLTHVLISKDKGKEVHNDLLKKLGIGESEIKATKYSLVNFAYTRHLLLSSKSWDSFIFAWTPCMVGYHEIGKIVKDSKDELYKEWASFYASDEYRERSESVLKELNSLNITDYLESLFENSVKLEVLFWDSALKQSELLFR